jgi:hypothetical protein
MKKHKQAFINLYGSSQWESVTEYGQGIRNPETIEAWRLYQQIVHGRTKLEWTIYTISENGKIIYVGRTGTDVNSRWSRHKSRARSLDGAGPIHSHMHTVSTDHKNFPEFLFQIITTTTDKQAAEHLEIAYIKAFNTHINGFNKQLGGGNGTKKFLTRPSQPDNVSIRNKSI